MKFYIVLALFMSLGVALYEEAVIPRTFLNGTIREYLGVTSFRDFWAGPEASPMMTAGPI
jgi:hypothetical protein